MASSDLSTSRLLDVVELLCKKNLNCVRLLTRAVREVGYFLGLLGLILLILLLHLVLLKLLNLLGLHLGHLLLQVL